MEKYTITKDKNGINIKIHDIELGKKVKAFFEKIEKEKEERRKEIGKLIRQGSEPLC